MSEPVFFLIAGEASGDLLGARVMRALRVLSGGKVRFTGIGGPHMQAEGLALLFPHTELMHFGVIEVLRHIPRLVRRINEAAQAVIDANPAALISIDSPDFCFRVAQKVKARAPAHIPLIHYVAPTVWAWRPGRAKKIAQFLDHLLAVLPFEPPYFTREGLDCTFVGHSVVEGDAAKGNKERFRAARNIAPETPLLTVLFGSRSSEFAALAPVFRQTVRLLRATQPHLQIAVPTVAHLRDRVAAEISQWDVPFHLVEGEADKYDAFAASRAALACSGTVALELALAKLPAAIAYKIHPLTALLYRRFIRVAYVNLVNIMHDKEVVPEFLQENCTPEKLARCVGALLSDDAAHDQQVEALSTTAQWLGQGQFVPSEKAAQTILDVVRKMNSSQGLAEKPAVLQVLPALVTGGVERGTIETANALAHAGFRAFVASAGGPMAQEVTAAGGTTITLPLASKNPWTILANVARLRRLIADNHINLVHARSRAPAWSAYLAARAEHIPFVTTFHNAYGASSWIKKMYNAVMGKGARVIAISDFVANYALRTYGVAASVLRVIPRGVDIDVFDRAQVGLGRIDALRHSWNLPAGKPVILLPGRITRWKGQWLLVRALARLKHRDFVCVIVGGGKDSHYGIELAQEISQAGLTQNVMVIDTCRDMPAAYCLADCVVVPSTRPEGFGRVVIEAQAMGTPVIASNHGGAMETVIPGETGWLTAPGDAEDLSRALDAVLSLTPERRQALALRSIAHIRQHFTTATMTGKTLDVYRELLSKPPSL